jgi:arabinose-5-phosphate isomerase
MGMDNERLLALGRSVLEREAAALQALSLALDERFCGVVHTILHSLGRVVVCGVGKAGLIGRKISASLASTGTRSFCLDPLDAMHGDLGMVAREDVVLLISNSGSSGEVLLVTQALKDAGIHTIAMTRSAETPLALMCDQVLPLGRHEEACPHNLAPTTSTTAMLALGDALAVTLEIERGFTREDYAQLHPAGALGRRLKKVSQCMRTGEMAAYAEASTTIAAAIGKITEARCGMCLVVDTNGCLLGVYTDGDLRRSLAQQIDITRGLIADSMTSPCKYVEEDALVEDAIEIMRSTRINALPVVDKNKKAVGILDIQDVA